MESKNLIIETVFRIVRLAEWEKRPYSGKLHMSGSGL